MAPPFTSAHLDGDGLPVSTPDGGCNTIRILSHTLPNPDNAVWHEEPAMMTRKGEAMSEPVTLEAIRKMFPKANHVPRTGCPKCGGKGVYDVPPEKAAKIKYLKTTGLPCICIYVDHELCDFASESLAATARKLRTEMDKGASSI